MPFYQHQSFPEPPFVQEFLDYRGDVDEIPAGGDVEPRFLAIGLHDGFFPVGERYIDEFIL